MRLNLPMVLVLFRNEVRMILRDKRSVMASIVLPLLLMPLMLFGSFWMQKQRETKLRSITYQYAVTGPAASEAREILDKAKALLEAESVTNSKAALSIQEVPGADPWPALTNGTLHFVLEAAKPEVPAHVTRPRDLPPPLKLTIFFRADRDDASAAGSRLEQTLRRTKSHLQDEMLKAGGFESRAEELGAVTSRNLADAGHVAGLSLGRMLTLLLLFFMLMAGAMVASDLIAGEKERGTLETLLTSGATRGEIVAAKQLVIMAVALTITCIQALNLLIYISLRVIPVPGHFVQAVPPKVALLLLLLLLPITGVISSVLLLTSGFAKTYKEAQMYFTPVFLLGLAPALVPMLPGLSLRSAIVLVPVANIAMATKEVLIGIYDWPMLILAWLITAATAVYLVRLTVRLLSAERLITSSETEPSWAAGGLALFERRVLRWFAVLWALLLMFGNYMEGWDIRFQIFVNIVVLFFGASMLMVRKYHLRFQDVFALRMPAPIVWPAMVAAAPCGVLAGTGLFLLANHIIPVPEEVIESFSTQVAPGTFAPWQLVFFLAVVPGVLEELTFRGALLHGLHRRLKPWTLALVVGLIFGIFHAALFRIAPTAFLGVLLAAVTLLTGSIFPAMLWHATSNALALIAGLHGLPTSHLSPGWYVFGAVGLACVFAILWRHRTPYPGLRTSKPPKEARPTAECPSGAGRHP